MHELLARLRALACYTSGESLMQRLAQTEANMAEMREGLTAAVAEIERLRAELKQAGCKDTPPTP
jgi:cell division protein FtsB